MDITKFCAISTDPRQHLHAPFRCSEGIAATNGHIFVCVPDDGGQHADIHDSLAALPARFKSYLAQDGRQWVDAAGIALPPEKPCSSCDGRGYSYEEDCDDCGGVGSFLHGSHWYDCKECNGNGKVKTDAATGKKEPCFSCDGTGEDYQPVKVGSPFLQRKYLAMLVGLPGCRVGTLGEFDTVSFTFDGGWGVVMPCRGD
jgi:hypothetical protein